MPDLIDVPVRPRVVSFTDHEGFRRSVEVQAETLTKPRRWRRAPSAITAASRPRGVRSRPERHALGHAAEGSRVVGGRGKGSEREDDEGEGEGVDGIMKLRPTLVPRPLWHVSAYRLLKRGSRWKKIRADVLTIAKDRCEACGTLAPSPQCNERWEYDDASGVATLAGFEILCPRCHEAAHTGRMIERGERSVAVDHLCRVNGVTTEKADEIIREAQALHRTRSARTWRVRVEAGLLRRYPMLDCFDVNKIYEPGKITEGS